MRIHKTHLNDAEIRLFASFVYWDLRYPFYPVLNSICDVGDDLVYDGFIKTVVESILIKHIHLHRPS
jgi:hypothetical protein